MKIPFHLRRRELGEPCSALLLDENVETLLGLCAGFSVWPKVYRVPTGFLVKLPGSENPRTRPMGAVRLRSLAADLFVPIDAELLPTLFEDETNALVRERGMLLLPGSRAFAYDLDADLPPSAFLRVEKRPSRAWMPISEPRRLAAHLREIVWDRPPPTIEQILEAGGEGIAEEEPRPPRAGPVNTARAHGRAALGKSFVWIGDKLNWRWLKEKGAKLIDSALDLAPRLSESLLGKQEAALRQLLEDFRAGRLEQALRRALPMGEEGNRGGVAAENAQLPTHSLRWSLGELFGGGSGPASIWFGGGDVMHQLLQEYRNAAQRALTAGDHRRAAYIYAKLLRDYHRAASILASGGLHRDAAILYLEKLNDLTSAAREFEVAGDFDKALEIYRDAGDHRSAGDLLRRMGEMDQALEEYRRAAVKLIENEGYAVAGDLFANHVHRVDLAVPYYRSGWRHRHGNCAAVCLQRLAQYYADHQDEGAFLALTKEACDHFASNGTAHDASSGFGALVASASSFPPAVVDEVQDSALLHIAERLHGQARRSLRVGADVSTLLGRNGVWPTEVVSDADVAFGASLGGRQDGVPAPEFVETRLGDAQIVACAWAPRTGAVVVLQETGQILRFEPEANLTSHIGFCEPRSHAITTNAAGDTVVVVSQTESACYLKSIHLEDTRPIPKTWVSEYPYSLEGTAFLSQIVKHGSEYVALWDREDCSVLNSPELTFPYEDRCLFELLEHPEGISLIAYPTPGRHSPLVALFDSQTLQLGVFRDDWKAPLGTPGPLDANCLAPFQVIVLPSETGPELHLLRVIESRLCYSVFRMDENELELKRSIDTALNGYLAGAILARNHFVGVHRSGLRWMRLGENGAKGYAETAFDLTQAVACYPSPNTNEVQVVTRDGRLLRFAVPH